LIDERLAKAGRKSNERIASLENCNHRLLLLGPEAIDANLRRAVRRY
jgi:hypothetical protein